MANLRFKGITVAQNNAINIDPRPDGVNIDGILYIEDTVSIQNDQHNMFLTTLSDNQGITLRYNATGSVTTDGINVGGTTSDNRSVELLHNGDLKLTTQSTGVQVTGILNATSVSEGGTALSAKYLGIAATAANSAQLNGQAGSFYTNATNLSSGILPAARFTNATHGTRSGGTLHADATTSVSGFMSGADKTKLDSIVGSGGTVTSVVAGSGLTGGGTGPTVNLAVDATVITTGSGAQTKAGTFSATTLQEGGTSLSAKYLGINATAANTTHVGGVLAANYLRKDVDGTVAAAITHNGRPVFANTTPFTVNNTTLINNLNAELIGGIGLSSLVRNDANNTMASSFVTTFNDNAKIGFGTAAAEGTLYSNGTGTFWDLGTNTSLTIRNATSPRFTFDSSTGNFNAQTNLQEGGTSLSAKYLGINATAVNSTQLGGIGIGGFVRSNVANTVSAVITHTAIPAFNGGTSGSTAPFTVDSTYKVANLNADLLDGIDSTGFALASHNHPAGNITGLGTAATRDVNTSVFDNTTGRIIRNGDFGLGAPAHIQAGGSVDTNVGNFLIGSGGTHANASTGDNPFPAVNGVFTITSSGPAFSGGVSTGYASQTAIHLTSGSPEMRYRTIANHSNGWSNWVTVFTDKNQLDIGTTPAAARSALALGDAALANLTTSKTDTTTGRVLKVGDNGIMGLLSANSTLDANNLQIGSKNAWQITEGDSAGLNLPVLGGVSTTPRFWVGDSYGHLLRSVQTVTEIFGTGGSWRARKFTRVLHDTWHPWVEDLTANHIGTASGQLMEVGAFGLGGAGVIAPADLNSISVSGFYKVTSSTNLNKPAGNSTTGDALLSIVYDSSAAHQVYYTYSTSRAFFRRKTTGVWADWVELYHSGNTLAIGTSPTSARAALNLGNSATRNIGTGSGTVAAGDDARLSDARTPTAHSHSEYVAKISGSQQQIQSQLELYTTTIGGAYNTAPIQIREVNGVADSILTSDYAPALTFWWHQKVQSQLALESNGTIVVRSGGGAFPQGKFSAGTLYENNVSIATKYAAIGHDHSGVYLPIGGTAVAATKWATGRTITLGGDLSGSVVIDGSAPVTLTATVADNSHSHSTSTLTGLGNSATRNIGTGSGDVATGNHTHSGYLTTTGKAADSDLLDGIDSASFLRSDVADSKTSGTLTFSTNVGLQFGSNVGALFYSNGSNLFTTFGTNIATWYIQDGSTNRFMFEKNGHFKATNEITAYASDGRLKKNITNIGNALVKVNQLNGVTYNFNDIGEEHGFDSDIVQTGLIAQEVEAVLPEVIRPAPFDIGEDGKSISGEDYKTIQYEKVVPLLVEAIKELTAKVEALENIISKQ